MDLKPGMKGTQFLKLPTVLPGNFHFFIIFNI